MSEWKEYKYTELCSIIGGGTPKTSETSYWGGNIPWLSVKDFGNVCKYVYFTEKSITQKGLEHSSTNLLQENDIIISARGTIGAMAMIPFPMAFNQSCFGIRGNELVNKHFLFYLTRTKITELQKNSHGSVFETITKDTFANIKCYIPSINEQQKIAAILSSLDDKIAVNRKISENLEQQAQALFKSWFVDFEPFKDGEFEESELGRIPKGWKVMSLTDIADYLNGLAMQKFRPSEGEKDLPVLKIKELGNGSCDSSSDRCSANISPEYIIENGDIIFSWSGTLLVDIWCGGRCGLNQHLFKVTSNNYPKWFYWLWTAKHLENFKFIARDKAVTMGHIKRSHLQEALVVVPNEETFKKADSIFAPIIDHIIESRIESQNLSQLRDTLLPKLMSGELKVNEI